MLRDLLTIKSFEDLRLFYFKYKDSLEFSIAGVGIIIVVVLFILIKVIIPQTQDWFSLQSQIKDANARIDQLRMNQNLISGLDSTQLEDKYTLATSALPYQKDYAGMIQAIDAATFASGMLRDDYSLEVGNLSTKSAQLAPQTTITVKMSLEGDAPKLNTFLKTLSEQLPLSEVVSIAYNQKTTILEVNFFYKFLPGSLTIPYTDPIRTISTKDQNVLDTIARWKKEQNANVTPNLVPSVPATPSGSPLP